MLYKLPEIFVSLQANRTNFNHIRESEVIPGSQEPRENLPNSEVGSFVSSEFQPYSYEGTSQVTDSASLNSAHASEFEDAESGLLAGISHFFTILYYNP